MRRPLIFTAMLLACLMPAESRVTVSSLTPIVAPDFPAAPAEAGIRQPDFPTPSMLTGAAEFEIPLYTLQLHDLAIPITLSYHSNGVNEFDNERPTGRGWSITPLLKVERQILGRPDELFPHLPSGRDLPAQTDIESLSLCYRCMTDSGGIYESYARRDYRLDAERDIFTIHLPGRTIKAAADNDSLATGPADKEYRVVWERPGNEIRVTDPLGRKYVFSGKGKCLNHEAYRTEWLLTELSFPSGQTAYFSWHKSYDRQEYGNRPAALEYYDTGDRTELHPSVFGTLNTFYNESYLNGISFGKLNLSFQYNDDGYMTVFSAGNEIKAELKYRKRHLAEISLSREGAYSFEYYEPADSTKTGKDWWGYPNGKAKGPAPGPAILYDSIGGVAGTRKLDGSDRDVSEISAKDGMLKKVILPTGGSVEWEYEVHRFPEMSSSCRPPKGKVRETKLSLGGGVRVRRVTMSEGDGVPIVRDYSYGENGDGLAVCEAAPLIHTFISDFELGSLRTSLTVPWFLHMSKILQSESHSRYMEYRFGLVPIWYREVTEVYPEGKTVYRFEKLSGQDDIVEGWGYQQPVVLRNTFSRGPQLICTQTFRKESGIYSPVSKTEYRYRLLKGYLVYSVHIRRQVIQIQKESAPDFGCKTPFEFDCDPCAGEFHNGDIRVPPEGCFFNLLLHKPYVQSTYCFEPCTEQLTGKTETRYTENGEIRTDEEYSYVDGTMLTRRSTVSDGTDTLDTETVYPGNDISGTLMRGRNMVGFPVGSKVRYGGVCASFRYRMPDRLSLLYNPLSLSVERQGTVYEVERYGWDEAGNIAEIARPDSTVTSYVWGYASDRGDAGGGIRPVLMISGCPVSSLNGKFPVDFFKKPESFGPVEIEGALVSRMTWNPACGPASYRSRAGVTTNYAYDGKGNLSLVSVDGLGPVSRHAVRTGHDRNNYTTVTKMLGSTSGVSTFSHYDGLGRHIADITEGLYDYKADGYEGLSRRYYVSGLTEYDSMGRPFRSWAPSSTGEAHPSVSTIRQSALKFHGESKPYSETAYEKSPLALPLSVTREGDIWHGSGKKTKMRHLTNDMSSMSCPKYRIVNGALTAVGNYAPGTLKVEETVDEDGHTVQTFTDMRGLKVMERYGRPGSWLQTRYVYDGYGDLRYVLPPKLPDSKLSDCREMHELAYSYDYDFRGNIVRRKLPGRKAIVYKYDSGGRLAAEQDGNTAPDWTVYLYDKFGREVMAGRADWTDTEMDSFLDHVTIARHTGTGPLKGYSLNRDLPAPLAEIHSLRKYNAGGLTEYEHLGATAREYSYDSLARVSTVRTSYGTSLNSLAVTTPIVETCSYTYTYSGEVDTERRSYTGIAGIPDITTRNVYDASGRLAQRWVFRGNVPAGSLRSLKPGDSIAAFKYEYDGAGRLAKIYMGENLERHYGYDVHGWPTGSQTVNKIASFAVVGGETGDPVAPFRSGDPFGTGGKLPVPDPFNPDEIRRTETTQTEKLVYATATGGCYNGNISLRTVPGGTYAYVYDTYNRLVSASFSAAEGSTGDYSAEYAYDGHANITSLTRRGVTDTYGGTVTFGLLDGITATLQGNRVTALELSTEAASYEGRTGYGLEGSYTLAYDDNGNVVSDGSRGISSISYNRHDQPVVITFSDGRRITNSYDDAGTLVSRTLRTGGRLPRTTTERYAGPHVGAMAANAVPAVGRSYFEGGYFDADGKVHYFVTDYQGNVLEDRKARGTVVASTGYYPYGEPWTEPRGGNDRWFGGKERLAAEGLPMSDFGPRLLNHAYPSWHTQDSKLEDYYPLSPYSYCAGNPVRYIDPTGEDLYFFNDNGKLMERIKNEEFDRIAVLNEKGVEKASLVLDYGTIESTKTIDYEDGTIDILKVRGDQNGTDIFEFFADNTSVEFTQIKCGEEGAKGLNFVVSGHDPEREPGQAYLVRDQLQFGYHVREHIHNHPSERLNASIEDITAAKGITALLNNYSISFKVYTRKERKGYGKYYNYNQNSIYQEYRESP